VASSWDLSIALRRDVNLTANSTARKLSLIDKGKARSTRPRSRHDEPLWRFSIRADVSISLRALPLCLADRRVASPLAVHVLPMDMSRERDTPRGAMAQNGARVLAGLPKRQYTLPRVGQILVPPAINQNPSY